MLLRFFIMFITLQPEEKKIDAKQYARETKNSHYFFSISGPPSPALFRFASPCALASAICATLRLVSSLALYCQAVVYLFNLAVSSSRGWRRRRRWRTIVNAGGMSALLADRNLLHFTTIGAEESFSIAEALKEAPSKKKGAPSA